MARIGIGGQYHLNGHQLGAGPCATFWKDGPVVVAEPLDISSCALEKYDLHALSGVMSAFGAGVSVSVSHDSIQAFIASAEMNFP